MSEMTDRVSMAVLTYIQEQIGTIICNLDVGRVAIEAMREPTKPMLGDFPALNRETWDEMIDVALDLCPQETASD